MKATGIVRRIDELGRVVIPKEIRRTQRIRRGDPLEIFTTGDGEVIFKKYSPIGELHSTATQYTDVLNKSFAMTAFVTDRDHIIAISGPGKREIADRSISQPLEKLMESRRPYLSEGVTGSVGLLTDDRTEKPDAAHQKAVSVAAAFLAKQMEE